MNQLIELEKQYPQFLTDDSPSLRVGGFVVSKFEKRKHQFPMLSLSNAFSYEELKKFDSDIKKELLNTQKEITYNVEPKIDGLSISLIYENGKLITALTRGDGEYGEDVTVNAKTIRSIPLSINTDLSHLEIRGEVYLTKKEFERINNELADDKQKFANPRNAAAGSLRNLDSSLTAKRKLEMIAYYIPDNSVLEHYGIKTQNEIILKLKELGFKTAKEIKFCKNIDEAIDYIDYLASIRDKIPFEIDGIVLKENEIKFYDTLGRTSKFPKWAIAYKFPPEIVQTKLLNINVTVGRTGRITYVGELEPIRIAGSTVSSATLHNAEYIQAKDIRIGDYVRVYKAGEIIPKVIGPVINKRISNLEEFKPAVVCPICNSLLEKQDGEVDQYCPNVSCRARILQSIIHFCSKKAMDIEELSDKNLEKLYEAKIITSIPDIYEFANKKELVIKSELKIKDKMFNNIVKNVEKSKSNSFEKLIFALGIRHVGETTAKSLAKTFLNIDNLASASMEQLLTIEDIGQTVAISIIDYFKNESNQHLITQLKDIGVNTQYLMPDNNQLDKNSEYYQKNFVITGSFDIPREEIKKLLVLKYDAKVTDSLTKTTDYLLVGQNAASKLDKAKQNPHIKIIYNKI